MMKALAIFSAVMMVAAVAAAFDEYNLHCDGDGNMVKAAPPVYTGPIAVGSDFYPGTWTMTVDDTGWPGIGDSGARWAYIWNNYYDYDAFSCVWTGTFNCDLLLVHDGVGSLVGVNDLTFQLLDGDCDGILDPDECMDGMSGAVIIINEGSGEYATLCGNGSYSGYYFRTCNVAVGDPNFMYDDVHFDMVLWLDQCGMGTDETTWGAVKALFR